MDYTPNYYNGQPPSSEPIIYRQTEQLQLEQEALKIEADTQIAKTRLEQEEVRLRNLQLQSQQKELDLALKDEEISDKIAEVLQEEDTRDTEA